MLVRSCRVRPAAFTPDRFQAAVRSFQAREAAQQAVREAWDEQAATWVDAAPPDAGAPAAGAAGAHDPLCTQALSAFMFFYTPRKDAARAQQVCQLMSRLLRSKLPLCQAHCTPPATHSCCGSGCPRQVI